MYDADFHPVTGTATRYCNGLLPRQTMPGAGGAEWVTASHRNEFAAQARGWGATTSGSMDGAVASGSQRAFFRAYRADEVIRLDDDRDCPDPLPDNARWYLSTVYVGRSFELSCGVEDSDMGAVARGEVSAVVAGGALEVGFGTSDRRSACQLRMMGVSLPQSGNTDLAGTFDVGALPTSGPSRVVMVKYSQIEPSPGMQPAPERSTGVRVILHEVRFPDRKADGLPWDVAGGAPDIVVAATLGQQRVFLSGVSQDRTAVSYERILVEDAPRDATLLVWLADQDLAAADDAGRVQVPLDKPGTLSLRTDSNVVVFVEVSASRGVGEVAK